MICDTFKEHINGKKINVLSLVCFEIWLKFEVNCLLSGSNIYVLLLIIFKLLNIFDKMYILSCNKYAVIFIWINYYLMNGPLKC